MELAGTEPPPGPSLNPAVDGYVITADRNIIHTRATVLYHIDDPRTAIFNFASGTNHVFNLAGVSNAVQNAANNALILTAARFNVDDILTRDVAGFQDAVGQRVSELVEREHLGVAIDQCGVVEQRAAPVEGRVCAGHHRAPELRKTPQRRHRRAEPHFEPGRRAGHVHHQPAETARTHFVPRLASDAEVFTKLLPKYQSNPRLYASLRWPRRCRRC